jgi:FkbM family methyltransferase
LQQIFQPASCILPAQLLTMLSQLAYLYRAWRYRFRVDPAEIRYLLDTLQAGDTAIDIGCHKGGYLYWMRRRVGRQGFVYAFEPQPRLFEYLTGIQQLFSFQNVKLENMGLSSQTGRMELHIPASSSGTSPGATLNALAGNSDFLRHEVQVTTLDAYFQAKGIRPALIKIDVEGHELEVLKGGRALLQTCRPRILMECENRHLNGGDVRNVFAFLLDLGYSGRFIHKGKLRPLAEFDAAVHQQQGPGRFWEAPDYVNNFVFE